MIPRARVRQSDDQISTPSPGHIAVATQGFLEIAFCVFDR